MRATLLLCALAAACGEAPVPVSENEPPPPPSSTAPGPSDPHAGLTMPGASDPHAGLTMPDDEIHAGLRPSSASSPSLTSADPHAVIGAPAEAYGGVVRLRGALAEAREAFLFVSIMPAGENRPGCSTKIHLADAPEGAFDEARGELAVPFELEDCRLAEGDVELQVWFDLDGFVDTREAGSVVRRHPVERASREIDVVLEPDA